MKLLRLSENEAELRCGEYIVLFSYQTPVAYYRTGVGYFKTATQYSSTTTGHINKWLCGAAAEKVTQEKIDNLFKEYEEG